MNLKISIYALLTLKKPQTESAKEKECGTSEVQQKTTKNQRDAKEADKKKNTKKGKCQAN